MEIGMFDCPNMYLLVYCGLIVLAQRALAQC